MKQTITKNSQGGVKMPYSAPATEVLSVRIENNLLLSDFVGGGSGTNTIDDLGETDTDAGSAIWS